MQQVLIYRLTELLAPACAKYHMDLPDRLLTQYTALV